jgi:hypothetical protein
MYVGFMKKIDILTRNILRVEVILLLAIFLLSGYFLTTSPVAFQKSAAIKFVEESKMVLSEPKGYIDIQKILYQIPYKKGGIGYEVQPKQRYSKTIQNGYGNCSNLAFGLAYYLNQQNHEYQIIHLLPPNNFLKGGGHTVINTPYLIKGKKTYGIVKVSPNRWTENR